MSARPGSIHGERVTLSLLLLTVPFTTIRPEFIFSKSMQLAQFSDCELSHSSKPTNKKPGNRAGLLFSKTASTAYFIVGIEN